MINQLINTTTQIYTRLSLGGGSRRPLVRGYVGVGFPVVLVSDRSRPFLWGSRCGLFRGLTERWMSQILEGVILVISL